MLKQFFTAALAAAVFTGGSVMAAPTAEHTLAGIESRLYQEISAQVKLEPKMQHLVKISAVTALGAQALLRQSIEEALDGGVSADIIDEAIIQGAPYAGLARAIDAENVLKTVMQERGLEITVDHGTVTDETRFASGLKQQTTIFGEGINKMHQNAKADERFLTVDQLTGWCFGDPYTRTGLSLKEHEFLTFCYITALGGNWPQVKAHVGGNLNMGTTRGELIDAVTVMMPIIGFPKSLNALGLINEAAPAQE